MHLVIEEKGSVAIQTSLVAYGVFVDVCQFEQQSHKSAARQMQHYQRHGLFRGYTENDEEESNAQDILYKNMQAKNVPMGRKK